MSVEERLLKLEFACDVQNTTLLSLQTKVEANTAKLTSILSSTESLDKIIKYIVTPLIAIVAGLAGVNVVT